MKVLALAAMTAFLILPTSGMAQQSPPPSATTRPAPTHPPDATQLPANGGGHHDGGGWWDRHHRCHWKCRWNEERHRRVCWRVCGEGGHGGGPEEW